MASRPDPPNLNALPHTIRDDSPTITAARAPKSPADLPTVGQQESLSTVADGPLPTIDGFRIIRELGRGGNGIVYLVDDTELPRRLALKLMRETRLNKAGIERFRREAAAMAKLNHAHVARVVHYACAGTSPYFTTEYYSGGSLVDHLAEYQADERQAVGLMAQLADAVQYLHDNQLVHRDIKPHNVFLDHHGEPHLGDLGLVRDWSHASDMTNTGAVVGTPAYMAPEQSLGLGRLVGVRTDIYALGVMLYELLVGCRPPQADDTNSGKLSTDLKPSAVRPGLDPALERMILQCMQVDPADRYPSAALLAEDLRTWLAGHPVPDRRPGRGVRIGRWAKNNKFAVSVSALLVLVAIGWAIARLAPALPNKTPKPDKDLLAMQQAFARDGRFVVVDDDTPIKWHEWIAGKSSLDGKGADGQNLSFLAEKVSMVEFARGLIEPGVQITAVVRQPPDDGASFGLYVGRSDQATDRGRMHAFAALSVADYGPTAPKDGKSGRVTAAVRSLSENTASGFGIAPVFRQEDFLRPANGWRTLTLRITRKRFVAEIDGQPFVDKTQVELVERVARLGIGVKGLEDFNPVIKPTDGIGLYAATGTVQIRSIVLTRIDQD